MKQGTLDHPKNLKLARLLQIEPWQSLGLLDAFVNFVAQYAPDGDISRIETPLIAEQMRYTADPSRMKAALVKSGFIDKRGKRAVVHDWNEHAPEYIKKRVTRGLMTFARLDKSVQETDKSGNVKTSPDKTGQNLPSRARVSLAQPSLAQPSPATCPDSVRPDSAVPPPSDDDFATWVRQILDRHPNPNQAHIGVNLLSEMRSAEDPEWRTGFDRIHAEWSEYWKADQNGKFAPKFPDFVRNFELTYHRGPPVSPEANDDEIPAWMDGLPDVEEVQSP